MRKRRAQGQQAAASGAFSWVVFYAFRSLFWRGLDNLSRLPADRARKALKWLDFYRPKCVDRRHFSTGPYPATTTKLKSESTGGNAFSISSRFVTPFRPLSCVFPQRPCVHYTELFVGFVGRSLTKPAQIVDIFLSAWDFSCVFISVRPKTGIFASAVRPLFNERQFTYCYKMFPCCTPMRKKSYVNAC